MKVAIDGPAGSGKSTIARIVARDEGFAYLDTGAMYRCVALAALSGRADLSDAAGLGALAPRLHIAFGRAADGSQTVLLDGSDVTAAVRTPQVDAAVSTVSAVPAVRATMVERQRAIAEGCDVVAEGRDIGTVVFPQAEVKVFLTASPEARAARRAAQNRARLGAGAEPEEAVLAAIVERDRRDASRAVAPLVAAADAVRIDSSSLSVEEVAAQVVALVRAARA